MNDIACCLALARQNILGYDRCEMVSNPSEQDDRSIPVKQLGIGQLQENSLHADLKAWYASPGDLIETEVDGYIIDIVRGDLLIEVQTRGFASLKTKLARLTQNHPVHLVYPIAQEKWIVRQTPGVPAILTRRKSPKRGRVEHLFQELVSIPGWIAHPNFSLEVLFTKEEAVWQNDGRGSWRRKGWSIADRRLLAVLNTQAFTSPADFRALLPPSLPDPFITHDLALARDLPVSLAQKMVYCLDAMGVLEKAGKRGRARLYSSLG